jgi:hypothetical protein
MRTGAHALATLLAASLCAACAAQGASLGTLRQQIQRIPADEVTAADRQRLDDAATQLQSAEEVLARQTAAMSPRERAMAEVQLGIAAERLKVAVTEQGAGAGWPQPVPCGQWPKWPPTPNSRPAASAARSRCG